MMELTYSVSLEPRDPVPEVAVENRKPFFRQKPNTADVYLKHVRGTCYQDLALSEFLHELIIKYQGVDFSNELHNYTFGHL